MSVDYCEKCDYDKLQAEIKRLQNIISTLRGSIADLQRHVKARSQDDPPLFLPASMCAIIGHMNKAAKMAKGGK